MDAVGHQLLGQHVQARLHRRHRRRGVQVQRQGDNHRLDAVGLGVVDQLLASAAVDLDVPPGLVFGLPTVLGHQSRPGGQRRFAVMVAVEGPPDVVRADVGDRADLEELGIDRPQQHAPLVAGADHADPQGRADGPVVAEIEGPQPAAQHHAGGHGPLDEVAARDVHVAGTLACGRRIAGHAVHDANVNSGG